MINTNLPPFKGPIEGYVVNHVKRNFWRVEKNMEYEDVMQDANVIYLKLALKYHDIDTPQHFMALFKTSWNNHFTDLSNAETASRAVMYENQLYTSDNEEEVSDAMNQITGDLNNNGFINTMIRQAPEEVRQVVALFANAPAEILELASNAWREKRKNSDYGNAMLCELLGIKPGTNVINAVESYFAE